MILQRINTWIKRSPEQKRRSVRSRYLGLYFFFFPKAILTANTKYGKMLFRNDHIGRAIYIGSYEEKELTFLEIFLTDNSVIADIGANIGYYTLFFASKPKAKIFAFEPSPKEYELLKKNIALNNYSDRVAIEQCLVSNSAEEKLLHLSDINFGTNTLYPDENNSYSKSVMVPSVTLDDYAKKGNINFDFIKLDVEGAELDVLKGALNVLRTDKPHVFIEVWGSFNKAFSVRDNKVTSFLADQSYFFYCITEDKKLKRINEGDHVGDFNVLAIHKDRSNVASNFQ